MNATGYRRAVGVVVIFLVLFASMTFFRVREYSDKSIDFQVLFKLIAVALSLVVPIGAVLGRKMLVAHRLFFIWLAFLLTFVMSSLYAPIFQVSFVGSVAFVGCFLFCVWMSELYGEVATAGLMAVIVGFVATVSLIVYYVHPDLGRMQAWLGSEVGENNRIRGIAGSANGLGAMTAVGLMVTILYYKRFSPTMRAAVLMAAIPTAICLVMTQNRMSFVSLIFCCMIYFGKTGNRAANFALMGLCAAAVVSFLLLAPDTFLSILSRSGDVSEITSGTGRTTIWEVVIEHIAASPLLGYGYASATFILPTDPRLFAVAAHTHNLYLEVFFSGGLTSFLPFIAAVLMTLYEGIRSRRFEAVVILLFFLLRGITEPSPFGGMPSFSAFAFFSAVSFVIAGARQREKDLGAIPEAAAESIRRCRANLHKATQAV